MLEAYEPRAEVENWASMQLSPYLSDPIARMAERQIVDAAQNFRDGCLKRNLLGRKLANWKDDRDWLLQRGRDYPFSLEWCVETLWVRARIRIDLDSIRSWAAREVIAHPYRRERRRPSIVRLECPRGEVASPA